MENNLVEIKGDIVTTTSMSIADNFGKQHKNVMQKIQRLDCSEKFNQLNFQPVKYVDQKGEERSAYQLTRDGFTYLAMGFTGQKAAEFKEKYIMAFNAMEKRLQEKSSVPSTVNSTMLKQIAENMERLEKERDYAVATKAQISDNKTATALAHTSAVVRQFNAYKKEVAGYETKSQLLSLQVNKTNAKINKMSSIRKLMRDEQSQYTPYKRRDFDVCVKCGELIKHVYAMAKLPKFGNEEWTNHVHKECYDQHVEDMAVKRYDKGERVI